MSANNREKPEWIRFADEICYGEYPNYKTDRLAWFEDTGSIGVMPEGRSLDISFGTGLKGRIRAIGWVNMESAAVKQEFDCGIFTSDGVNLAATTTVTVRVRNDENAIRAVAGSGPQYEKLLRGQVLQALNSVVRNNSYATVVSYVGTIAQYAVDALVNEAAKAGSPFMVERLSIEKTSVSWSNESKFVVKQLEQRQENALIAEKEAAKLEMEKKRFAFEVECFRTLMGLVQLPGGTQILQPQTYQELEVAKLAIERYRAQGNRDQVYQRGVIDGLTRRRHSRHLGGFSDVVEADAHEVGDARSALARRR